MRGRVDIEFHLPVPRAIRESLFRLTLLRQGLRNAGNPTVFPNTDHQFTGEELQVKFSGDFC